MTPPSEKPEGMTAYQRGWRDGIERAAKEAKRFSVIARKADGGWGGGYELATYFDKLAENIESLKPDGGKT